MVPRYPGTAAAAGAGGLTAGGLVGRGVGRGVGGLGTGLGGRAGAGAGKAAADGAGARGPLRWRLGDLGSAVELQEVARDGAPGLHLEVRGGWKLGEAGQKVGEGGAHGRAEGLRRAAAAWEWVSG